MTPTAILTAISQVFPVKPADITGPRRRRNETEARQLACHLMHDHCRMSNRQIGEVVGLQHSGVTTSRQTFAAIYATDRRYAKACGQVMELLGINQEIAA